MGWPIGSAFPYRDRGEKESGDTHVESDVGYYADAGSIPAGSTIYNQAEEKKMAGAKTMNKNAGKKGTTQLDRFLKGTDEPVFRLRLGPKKRFVWAVKNSQGVFRHVDAVETELR